MKDYKNILIIKMSSLGDVIHALPTLYAVRKNWPNAHITWAIHEQFESLLWQILCVRRCMALIITLP